MTVRRTKEDRARDAVRDNMTEPIYKLLDQRRANILMAIKHLGYEREQAIKFIDDIIVEINQESEEYQRLYHKYNL